MQANQENIIGKTVCASITYFNSLGQIDKVVQNCGTVLRADNESIEYQLLDDAGKVFSIPAFYDELEPPSKELVYYLNKESNEVIYPDWIITLSVLPEKEEPPVE